MKFRNVSTSSPRKMDSGTPHFTFQVLDERRVMANIIAVITAKSPTRGIYYINQFSSQGLYSTLTSNKRPNPKASDVKTAKLTNALGGRVISLLSALHKAAAFSDAETHPITRYYQSMKHTDLFADSATTRDNVQPIFDSVLLTLVAEQPGSVVQYPIGDLMLNLFADYVTAESLSIPGVKNLTESGLPEILKMKAKGQHLKAVPFSATADSVDADIHINLKDLFFLQLTDNWFQRESKKDTTSDFAKTLISTDVILNVDLIIDALKNAAKNVFAVKSEDKLVGIRKVVSIMMAIIIQPYLMYVRLLLDILANPVTAKFLYTQYPNLASSNVIADLEKMMEQVKFTPVYVEMIRHYRVNMMETAIGKGGALIVPAGLAHYLPFLSGGDVSKRKMSSKDKEKAENLELSAVSGHPMTILDLGNFDPEKELSLTAELAMARSVLETYVLGDDANQADYMEAMGTMGGSIAPSFRALDRFNPPVFFTDTVLANAKMDYDNIVEGLLVPQLALLAPSPQRKGILVDDSRKETSESLTRSIHSLGEIVLANVSHGKSSAVRLLDGNLSLLGIQMDSWFDKFTVGSKALLNGRLPMTRYNADLDGTLVPHSTLANFASDIGLDPRLISTVIENKNSELGLMYGAITTALINEFFTSEDNTGLAIPDAEEYGLNPKYKFSYAHYLVSSRGRVMANFVEVVLNPTLPGVQRVVYNDFGRSGLITLATTQHAMVDTAFESSILDDAAVLAHSCGDLITRLKLT
jgi:hypothetical protein